MVRTVLDAGLQRGVEGLAAEVLAGLPARGSVAVLVADLRTREVRALLGGDWLAEGRAGALDLTRAVRSPGSALKPLLYAMAFDRGLAGPATVIEDLPRNFGDWSPENYARGFSGRVTAAEALRGSLNLPAVALMEALGPLRFASALKALGAAPRLPPGTGPAPVTRAAVKRIGTVTGAADRRPLPAACAFSNPVWSNAKRLASIR